MKKTFWVQGMHCVSCEMLLEKGINEIKGVKVEKISEKKGKIIVKFKHKDLSAKVEKTVLSLGYKLGEIETCKINNKEKKNTKRWIKIGLIVAAWAIVFLLLKQLNIYQYFGDMLDGANAGVALLMGIVASLSTCLAVTGSIVLGFSEYIDDSKGRIGHIKTQASFQIGRIVGFFVLGGLLGLVGQVFKMSLGTTALLTIFVGIVILYMGLHMLQIVPSISKAGFHLPKSGSKKILTVKNPAFAPVIGMLTFFLPCGFTQSMQLLAINGGSFWSGGLIMAAFALGTAPVLFAVGMGGNYIKEHKYSLVSKAIGILIIIFGLFSLNNGWNLLGVGNKDDQYMSINTEDTVETVKLENAVESIEVGHNGRSLEPQKVYLESGKDYKITITPSANGRGCMSTLTIPRRNRDVHRVIKNQAIVYNLRDVQSGKYDVVCASMGMYQGEFIVK